MPEILEIPAEMCIGMGASVIPVQRPLAAKLHYSFTHIDDEKTRKRDLFLQEPEVTDHSYLKVIIGTHLYK